MKIRIGGLLDFSTIDWPGHVTFMLFCSGCNFKCLYCQNSSLIPIHSGSEINLEFIKRKILANIKFLDALGFSGGEPTLQPKPLLLLCEWGKAKGLEIFLNTNGSNPRLIDELLRKNLLDYIAMDIKAPLDKESYGRVIGLKSSIEKIIANIKETLKLCRDAGLPMEIRTTVVPTLIDDEKSIREIAYIINKNTRYVLQEFSPFGDILDAQLKKVKLTEKKILIKLAKTALEMGVNKVYIRTKMNGLERFLVAD